MPLVLIENYNDSLQAGADIYHFLDSWKTQSNSQSMLLCRSIDRKVVLMILDSWHCNALDVEINTHHCLDHSPPTLHRPGNNKSNHQGLEIFVNLVQQNSSFDSSAGTISHCRHLFSFPLPLQTWNKNKSNSKDKSCICLQRNHINCLVSNFIETWLILLHLDWGNVFTYSSWMSDAG